MRNYFPNGYQFPLKKIGPWTEISVHPNQIGDSIEKRFILACKIAKLGSSFSKKVHETVFVAPAADIRPWMRETYHLRGKR